MNGDLFRATVKKYMEMRHIRTKEQLRAHTTIGSNKTFGKYWNDPEKMPLGEFLLICKALNIPVAERMEILG